MIDNHTATQHEFTRKCLRLFTEDIGPVKLRNLEEEISVYAEGIIHLGGYDLDTQLAALAAERDALRAKAARLENSVKTLMEFFDGKITRRELEYLLNNDGEAG